MKYEQNDLNEYMEKEADRQKTLHTETQHIVF